MAATLLDPTPHAIPSLPTQSAAARWTGRVLTGLAAAFLAVDAAFKFVPSEAAAASTATLGWQLHQMPILGTIAAVCLVLYLIPRTAPLGAILWTGYFGGAIATHLRVDNPLATHTLFPIYVAALVWGGLYLRDARVRALLGPRR